MLTDRGLVLMCNECDCIHVSIDPDFDGFQWWDHCPLGCGFTPHASTWPGVGIVDVSGEDDEFNAHPVPEV
jgi:hypothetical protein